MSFSIRAANKIAFTKQQWSWRLPIEILLKCFAFHMATKIPSMYSGDSIKILELVVATLTSIAILCKETATTYGINLGIIFGICQIH